MTREIKFRAWNTIKKKWVKRANLQNPEQLTVRLTDVGFGFLDEEESDFIFVQYTGLKDNSERSAEIYEGDIIDQAGRLVGNKYESPQIHEEGITLTVAEMGTNAWRDTESIAMGRGCKYA